MTKRPLVPAFLQKLDTKLLLNKPAIWASRAHLVLYFAAFFALLLFMFCYVVFFDAKQYSNINNWGVFIGLLVFIGLVFWLIYLLRFNVFKRYGNWGAFDGWRDFILYFISIGAMISVCFIPSAVQTMRANQQFGDEEIINDINELNIHACRLEYNILPLVWTPDSCQLVDKRRGYVEDNITNDQAARDTLADVPMILATNRYRLIDSAELSNKLQYADSLIKLNDSMYVFYECPNYRFASTYNADEFSTSKMMGPADIYRRYLMHYKTPDRTALQKRMKELQTKYAVNSRYYSDDYRTLEPNDNYETRISKKYDFARINNGLYNIVQKKQTWRQDWDFYLRTCYYLTLVLTMLVFIFRHSTIKTFFLSALTAVLLSIITGLMMVFSYGDEGIAVLSFMILYYVVFAGIALSIFATKSRTAVQGIGLNLCLFGTPFIPLIFLGLTKQIRENNQAFDPDRVVDHHYEALQVVVAETAGFFILILLIQPLFKKLYRKWYSAPQE